jgi:hypothetical protein
LRKGTGVPHGTLHGNLGVAEDDHRRQLAVAKSLLIVMRN